ncbi:unnamed protein product [Brassica oleracea var. botrytis]
MRNPIGYSSLSLSLVRLKPPQSLSADTDPKMKQSFYDVCSGRSFSHCSILMMLDIVV